VPAVRRHPAAVSDIIRHLGHSQEEMDQPILDLTWDYPVKGEIAEPDAEAVLAEINGWDARGRPIASYEQLRDDGTSAVRDAPNRDLILDRVEAEAGVRPQ